MKGSGYFFGDALTLIPISPRQSRALCTYKEPFDP